MLFHGKFQVIYMELETSLLLFPGNFLLTLLQFVKKKPTNYSWFQINKDSSWDVFSSSCLREESVETVVSPSDGFVTWHLAIRLDPMLKAVEFPTGVANLHSGLATVDADTFTLK